MLTKREYEIYKIIHSSDKPMNVSAIVSTSNIGVNTVQATTKKLLKKGLIKVAGIGYSGTVLCRTYVPGDNAEEILAGMFAELYDQYKDFVSLDQILNRLE